MTERRILFTLKRIEAAKISNNQMEVLLRLYHLNISILKYLAIKLQATDFPDELKAKHIVEQLIARLEKEHKPKTFITKKNLKILKPWLSKMDAWFKTCKTKEPSNTKQLISDSEKILAVLKISASKLFISNKK